jgi:soluble lytic murein transglycosylase-like protein
MMRRSLLAILLVVLVVPALSGPASARQHSVHHRYRFARQHVLPVPADNFAPGLYAYAPDTPDTYARDTYAPVFATRETKLRQSNLRQNNWRQNDWGQSNFGQSSWSQNSFNQATPLDGMAAAQASANGVPVSLVERVIKRESGGNPRAVSRGNYGLMQIRLGTARAMGFSGSAELLDPQVNMTYAVRYLAGAYRAANGNENRAVALYASGYYYQAKAQGFSPYAAEASSGFGDYYSPRGFQNAEAYGSTTPVYRVRHYRHRAV